MKDNKCSTCEGHCILSGFLGLLLVISIICNIGSGNFTQKHYYQVIKLRDKTNNTLVIHRDSYSKLGVTYKQEYSEIFILEKIDKNFAYVHPDVVPNDHYSFNLNQYQIIYTGRMLYE